MKKKIILVLTAVLLAILAVYLFTKPKKSKETTPNSGFKKLLNSQYKNTVQNQIEFVGTQPKGIPNTLKVYNNTTLTGKSLARSIAKNLKLSQSQFSQNVWVSNDSKSALVYDDFNYQIEYSSTSIGNNPTNNFVNSLSIAKAFLDQLGISNALTKSPTKTTYITGLESTPTKKQNASHVKYEFEQSLDDIPLAIETALNGKVTVIVDNKGKTTKATFPDTLFGAKTEKELSTLNFNLVTTNIQNGKGEIINITDNLGIVLNTTDIKNTQLNQVNLEYRYLKAKKLLVPYFVFSGKTTLKNSKDSADITIVHPAVDTNQL